MTKTEMIEWAKKNAGRKTKAPHQGYIGGCNKSSGKPLISVKGFRVINPNEDIEILVPGAMHGYYADYPENVIFEDPEPPTHGRYSRRVIAENCAKCGTRLEASAGGMYCPKCIRKPSAGKRGRRRKKR